MSYGQDGPCTLAEADDDDSQRYVADDATLDALAAFGRISSRDARPGSQSDAQSSTARMDVPAAARAGEAQRDALAAAMYGEPVTDRDRAYADKALGFLKPELASLRAKVAGVEAAVAEHPNPCPEVDAEAGITCGWKRAYGDVVAALADPAPVEQQDDEASDGCDCTELCEMGPTCPGGSLAGLAGSGCWRTSTPEPQDDERPSLARMALRERFPAPKDDEAGR